MHKPNHYTSRSDQKRNKGIHITKHVGEIVEVSYNLINDLEFEPWEYRHLRSLVELYRPCGSSRLVWELV